VLAGLYCKVFPLATVVPAAVVPKPVVLENTSVPALTVVAPLYVFAPLKVSVPLPFFVSVLLPLMTPLMVNPPVESTVVFAPRATFVPSVCAALDAFVMPPLTVKV